MIYLQFKSLPAEKQKEITRQITPTKGKVMEWTPPQAGEDKAFKRVLRKIGL